MADSNRVVETLRAYAKQTSLEQEALAEVERQGRIANDARRAINEMLQQVEWGVGPRVPERAVQVDGTIYRISFTSEGQPPVIRILAVENL